ncbi:hypothetical protein NW759_016335 [Fusarium solani]|nr:hypothetical protein NW759_016335 [Fusarium solani]
MADIYTPPPDYSYLLQKGFSMPSHNGDRWAVSFSNNGATIMAAALSVIVTVSFLCLWNLIAFFGLLFDGKPTDGKPTRRRYVAMVMLWNSNHPWFAFKALLDYSIQCMKHPTTSAPTTSKNDLWYGFCFCLVAFAAFTGSLVMGIFAPSLVQIGNVAPVRPNTVFYPVTPSPDRPVEALQEFGLRAPAVMRSLGSVEAAKVTLRSRVLIDYDDSYSPARNGDTVASLGYTYNLTGAEMGLQKGSDLALDVEGFCITEYGWAAEVSEKAAEVADYYYHWNKKGKDTFTWVLLNNNDILNAPKAAFLIHPDGSDQMVKDSNVSYAVIVHSAHRSSITESNDPWYVTESRPTENVTEAPYDAKFWMRRERPVLSCWEKSNWRYGKHTVDSVYGLKDIPGMKIKEVLLDVLEAALGTGPMIARLGNASGDSALRSRTTSPNGVINAQASKMKDDMERLILAAFVATRSIFTDTTMFGQPDDYTSVFTGPDKQPRDGSGNFVVSSPDIQTFSLTGIVTLVVILGALMLANTITWACLSFYHNGSSSPDRWTRYRVLEAAQLFRCLYEVDGKEAKWDCDKVVPNMGGINFVLLQCDESNSGKAKCMGHIKTGGTGDP